MQVKKDIAPQDLKGLLVDFWTLSGQKIKSIEQEYDSSKGAPVFTVNGKYSSRGWTEWTEGFQYGSALLQFEATGDEEFLNIGRKNTLEKMAPHLTHIGVHDHGFNNISTYGNLLRFMKESLIPQNDWEQNFYELAIKNSGAVQASRWTKTVDGGYIYSFNGPHSLFVDTIRSVRILMLSHLMGHKLKGENDVSINLLERGIKHILSTAKYNVYYGEGRDSYDVWGRTAHECIFNTNDGNFRAPNAQQGFSGFTTWTRGLAWAICGFAEELELMSLLPKSEFEGLISKKELIEILKKGAKATCDFFIENTALDGITYWDTGAPNIHKLGDYTQVKADPYNDFEPVDSTAAAIAAQGLIRLGKYLNDDNYIKAGLTTTESLLQEPYLSTEDHHQGILLHSIYHQPNGWDNIPEGQKIACHESSMWGDYHIRELAIQVGRMIENKPDYAFYNCLDQYRNR
ncbi:glycoside hydrolase family 88 protein [Jiulongibacter sediminis]|uniref:Glycosyl hydrolase n=1 Tax=Jiulongibacter sediminis TaxID=1605367 RepID=A0A0P7C4T6_9BACT|nr:glycoside hydrolase family 88 protein [Jiulongibacter sediminis]KPM49355.1 glycosyl hydrolase [Jiulongibacter sediminis]TBX26405.1 glycosyl hydrolase [Jiulongibacter sediminis]